MTAKNYTFYVYCTFRMQYIFNEDEVQRDPGGDETDFEPKDEALEALERELAEYLSETYPVTDVDASADSNSFIGVDEEQA
ncbi:MAG: hypothetical protein HYS12_29805 [Planctomycetes bacterium]|nr:hypothetical protein [Planctomycetota bacterium]